MASSITTTLVADVGGTNTRVGLASGGALVRGSVRRFPNEAHTGLDDVLSAFVAEHSETVIDAAAVAVAGPVGDGTGELTNRAWAFDTEMLRTVTDAKHTVILNDLQAQGYALAHLDPTSCRHICGPAAGSGTKLVVGVGTGFNVAVVYTTKNGRFVPPAEAGHAGLPVRTEAELRLGQFLESAHGYASVEDAMSGRGIERLYSWASNELGKPGTLDASSVIAAHVDGNDPAASLAVEKFVTLFGAECGNLALNYLPVGGLYIIGGAARAMSAHFDEFGFEKAFCDKGRFSEYMQRFPVLIVEDDYAALNGLATYFED